MAQMEMFPAVANSPATELSAAITDIQTTITLLDASKLPDAPNIATIGVDESAETVRYAGKSGNDLTGVTRGFSGTLAKAWGIGVGVARYFTAYDADALRGNVAEHSAQLAEIEKVTPTVVNLKFFPRLVGEIDDTNRFRRAIAYMKVNANKALFVPPQTGNYQISGEIVIDILAFKMSGQNTKTTRIEYTTPEAVFKIVPLEGYGYHAYDIIIENMQFYGNNIAKKGLWFDVSSQIDLSRIECNVFTECAIDMYKGGINSLYHVVLSHSPVGIRLTETNNISMYSMNFYKNVKDVQFVGLNDNVSVYGSWSEESYECVFYMSNVNENARINNLNVDGINFSGDPTFNSRLIKFESSETGNIHRSVVKIKDSHIYAPDADYLIEVNVNGNTRPESIHNIVFEGNTLRKPLLAIMKAHSTNNKVRFIYRDNIESSNATLLDGDALLSGLNSGGSALSPFNKVSGELILGTSRIESLIGGALTWDTTKKHIKMYDESKNVYLLKGESGTTRPSGTFVGQIFFDANLKKPIWFTGTSWVDATGTVV
ncbi:hypothetical protein BSK66_08040 [Paenibacillus odorifer]|uniref:hypothetical protein n=1 Tax=Paenibacillus TaxID=44249 RepID=UPI0003E2A121|nr:MULTISPECIES: hypothetical protein [Paenibacillus]ETT64954.1 putative tail fiber protein [Paenibacillus sp. FSL H8-237]OME61071.1 hypothetical protein BSK66_08040 [Paenibacillus odorifer]